MLILIAILTTFLSILGILGIARRLLRSKGDHKSHYTTADYPADELTEIW